MKEATLELVFEDALSKEMFKVWWNVRGLELFCSDVEEFLLKREAEKETDRFYD